MTDLSRHLQKSTGPRTAFPTVEEVRAARSLHASWRAAVDRQPASLLDGNTKLDKGGAIVTGLSLYPGRIDRATFVEAGLPVPDGLDAVNVCRWSTPSCDPARGGGCLGIAAGRNVMSFALRAKLDRTLFAYVHPEAFVTLVLADTRNAVARGKRVRLNVTSDLEWHRIAPVLFAAGSPTRDRIYDYTKDHRRVVEGWHLTYSASERHGVEAIRDVTSTGRNVSVVLDVRRGRDLPEVWHGIPVIDGDATDHRWLDPAGVVVGLRAKDATGHGLSAQNVSVRSFVKPAS